MAWVRCCGSNAPSVTYPIDLLTYLAWDTSPKNGIRINGGSAIGYWTSASKTPKLKSGAVINGNLCNYGWGSNIHLEVQVSEDGSTWNTVMQNSNTAGQLISASLASYVNKELFIRFKCTNTSPAGYDATVNAIYPTTTGIFQIV